MAPEVNISAYIDKITNARKVINYEHHEVHSGSHFYVAGHLTKALSETIEFIVTSPTTVNKWAHMIFIVQSTKGVILEVFRGPTGITGGTTITPLNSNENFSDNAETTIKQDPTSITADGTARGSYASGSNIRSGIIERSNELILKHNTVYLFRLTSQDNTNLISWLAEFYEHTNKNLDN